VTRKSIRVFKLAGFDVRVDFSWVFLALFIAWSLAEGFFPTIFGGLSVATYWWMAMAGVVGLFFSIALHELAHSLVARRYAISIRGTTLFVFGGVAEMEDEPASPKAEMFMAIAGPIASGVLALTFLGVSLLSRAVGAPVSVSGVAHYLALLNGALAVFNLLPAYPLDGGRVFRSILWYRSGDLRRATWIASRVGAAVGVGMMGVGFVKALTGDVIGGIWLALLGLFLRSAALASYLQVVTRRALEGEPVGRFMTTAVVTVPPTLTVRELVENYIYRYYHDLFPVVDGSRLIGCVGVREVKTVRRENWDRVTVSDIVVPFSEANTVPPDEDAVKALSKMQRTGNSRLIVVKSGHLVGIIALKDLLKLLALKMDLETKS